LILTQAILYSNILEPYTNKKSLTIVFESPKLQIMSLSTKFKIRFSPSGFKEIRIRKFEYVAKT